uniref:Uncharacterized protein n=1 Tax=Hyaloperonospora arabidopsidis (strain Emoy2) TaxID=559515 RepID=M4BV31_HYAAE
MRKHPSRLLGTTRLKQGICCTSDVLGAQSRVKQPPELSEIRATTNTASTATSCSGQGTPVRPRRRRLYFFPASDRTLFHADLSATVYSI